MDLRCSLLEDGTAEQVRSLDARCMMGCEGVTLINLDPTNTPHGFLKPLKSRRTGSDRVSELFNQEMAVKLDLDTFSVHKLQTEDGLNDAFKYLNNALAVNHIEDVVSDLLNEPGLLVYMFSVFPNIASMRTKILDAFPADSQILQQSYIPSLLPTLSAFFFSLPSDIFHGDESRIVGRYERYVTDVWPAMAILSSVAFGATTGCYHSSQIEHPAAF